MATELTDNARAGWETAGPVWGVDRGTNPHLHSSACWFGFEAGKALGKAGYTKPIKATMGRGYTVNVWTAVNRFRVAFNGSSPAIERLGEG